MPPPPLLVAEMPTDCLFRIEAVPYIQLPKANKNTATAITADRHEISKFPNFSITSVIFPAGGTSTALGLPA